MSRARVAAVVAVAVAVLAACVPPYEGAPAAPRVAIVSDSVLGMAEDMLVPNLRADRQVSQARTNAARVADLQAVATEFAATDPDVVVISAGTNDVFGRLPPSTTVAQLQAMVAKFPNACVTVVTLNSNIPDADIAWRSQQVNHWIRSRSQYADWDAWVAGYYQAGSPSGQLTYDMIHVTPVGKPHLTAVVSSAARRCLNRARPFGSIDAATTLATGTIRVQGWAVDADTNNPIDVHVYVDGALRHAGSAATSRPDVGAAFPFGAGHGFDVTVSAPPGGHTACVYAINVAQGNVNSLLGCRSLTVT
jgi:hypothetical protein